MEFTVSKADLVTEMSLSQGVVEKKTTIPILSNVLLEAAGDRVTLTATDLELGIRCSCPARVKKEGAGTVPARKLLDYARLLPDGDVNMKFLENHWANITSGRSKTRIAGMSRESFPELPQIMPSQQRNILSLSAQLRHPHRNHLQPVIQILPELAIVHRVFEILVRCRDHAHVNCDRLRPTNPVKLPGLQHPQKFRL